MTTIKSPPVDPARDLRTFTVAGRDDEVIQFDGVLLGTGTSQRDEHTHHRSRTARKGEKCSACRWFEVALYRRWFTPDRSESDYVVHTVGVSTVPGEQRLSRVSFTTSAFEVLELLTVRKPDSDPFIAVQSSRALAQAASRDEDIRDAYINRAVV